MKFMIFLFIFQLLSSNDRPSEIRAMIHQENTKITAYLTLQKKCNPCHATKKRTDIFTLENMDSLALDIWKQVFVKKKMPKGRKVILTEEEIMALRTWMDNTLVKIN